MEAGRERLRAETMPSINNQDGNIFDNPFIKQELLRGLLQQQEQEPVMQFDTSNAFGRFPATIPSAVAAKLPDDLVYDRVTYESSPNENVFTYDDGYGNLIGMCSGTINYETGEIHMLGCPANGEFVYSCLHTSPFSGKANATDAAKMNKLKAIYGNMPNQKGAGELTITRR